MMAQAGLERLQRGRIGGTYRPADRQRIGLEIDVLDHPPGRVQRHIPGQRGQAIQCNQDIIQRPDQRHGVKRFDPHDAGDPIGTHRGRKLCHPVQPARSDEFRVVISQKHEVVVAKRFRGLLINRHVRVVIGKERADRLFIADLLAEEHQPDQQRGGQSGRQVAEAQQESNHGRRLPLE